VFGALGIKSKTAHHERKNKELELKSSSQNILTTKSHLQAISLGNLHKNQAIPPEINQVDVFTAIGVRTPSRADIQVRRKKIDFVEPTKFENEASKENELTLDPTNKNSIPITTNITTKSNQITPVIQSPPVRTQSKLL
jgi:hypothetical protein